MPTYKIGLSQSEWDALKKDLIAEKLRQGPPVQVGVINGSSSSATVDTLNITLDINLRIIHLDVGQGESTLILLECEPALCRAMGISGCLMSILIDGGLTTDGGGVVARALRIENNRDLDAAIISHFDADHAEGVTRVIKDLSVMMDAETAKQACEDEHTLAVTHDSTVQSDPNAKAREKKTASNRLAKTEKAMDAATQRWSDLQADLDENATRPARSGQAGWKAVQTHHVIVRQHPDSVSSQTGVVGSLSEVLECVTTTVIEIEAGDTLELDCDADRGLFKMACLAVNQGEGLGQIADRENANSIAWLLSFGKYRYYTAGDLPSKAGQTDIEDALAATLQAHAPLTAIKCGHHGSQGSTSALFLQHAQPCLAFISSGKQDGFGHPHTATLLRLWQATDMQAIFVTNSYYARPLIYDLFLEKAAQFALRRFQEGVDALGGWPIPDIDPSAVASKRSSEAQLPNQARELRLAWDTLCTALETTCATLATDPNNAADTIWQEVAAAPEQLANWANDKAHERAASALARGIETDMGVYKVDVKKDSDAYKAVNDRLREAAALAKDIIATKTAFSNPPANPPKVHLAGDHDVLGHVTLWMDLVDCDKDDRACYVGYDKAAPDRWIKFGFGALASSQPAVEAMPDAPLLDAHAYNVYLDMEVPSTPGTFIQAMDERAEQQKDRKRKFEDIATTDSDNGSAAKKPKDEEKPP